MGIVVTEMTSRNLKEEGVKAGRVAGAHYSGLLAREESHTSAVALGVYSTLETTRLQIDYLRLV